MGGGAGQLLPLPVERRRRRRATGRRPVVQPERGERPALRLQAGVRGGGGRVRGGEVDGEEGEVAGSHVGQRAGLRPEAEAALPHIPSVQRRRRPERPAVPFPEPGAAPAHQNRPALPAPLNSAFLTPPIPLFLDFMGNFILLFFC